VAERPILFSVRMVRAILAGEKTQTRRVIKHPTRGVVKFSSYLGYMLTREGTALLNGPDYPDGRDDEVRCPYGVPGDKLWVRERWKLRPNASGVERQGPDGDGAIYAATWDKAGGHDWKPSIHMPRWASRITLKVARVRVEPLQNITEDDVKAEGIRFDGTYWLAGTHPVKGTLQCWATPQQAFKRAWDEIHGQKISWSDNPWVWVVEFRRMEDIRG
jgi:hypothetical protein